MIYTFTLNPCIDRTYTVDGLNIGGFTRAKESRYDLSGKGINVSLDLGVLGIKTVAAGFMGEADAERYKKHIESYGAAYSFVPVGGEVRVNCKIIDKKTGMQTDVNEAGITVSEKDKSKLFGFASGLTGNDIAVISGSSSPGFSPNDFEKLVSIIKGCGAKIIIDTEKTGLNLAERIGAIAVKPNFSEFCGWTGIESDSVSEIAKTAASKTARISNVIVSLGENGAVFATGNGCWHAYARDTVCVCTTGAGDALLSGFLYGIMTGKSYNDCIVSAIATASAKVSFEGTCPPAREKVEYFTDKVVIEKIKI